jgi:hypothetical protein
MDNQLTNLQDLEIKVFGSSSNTMKIITRGTDEKLFELKSLNSQDIIKIAEFMPEVNRATNAFGKTQSQFMNNVMTISSFSPIRNLRQCLAEIERRRGALKESVFKLKKDIIMLEQKKEEYSGEGEKYKKLLLSVEIEELESNIADARLYIEGALKTIYSYELAYKDIMRKFNIPLDWDEQVFEEAEEEHHIKKAFQQAHADMLSSGRIGQGNHEYFWQCGIHPQSAFNDLSNFIAQENTEYNNSGGVLSTDGKKIGIKSFSDFLNKMYQKYKGSSREILEIKGINPDGFYDVALFKDLNQKTDL